MPTYQYACRECGHAFDQVQSFSDESLTECPQCTGRLRKVFNAVGVVFKGSGFYRNDSRKSVDADGKDGVSVGKGGDAGAGEKSDSKSDSKTDASNPQPDKPAPKSSSSSSEKPTTQTSG